MLKNILIIGVGGVGTALAKKCAQHNHELGEITVAARRLSTVENAVTAALPYRRDAALPLHAAQIDANDTDALADLIAKQNIRLVLNAASPYVNLSVMDGCLKAGAHYVDCAVYEREGATEPPPPPWYERQEWNKRAAFAAGGLTGILSIGFDPGAVNVFSAYARDVLFDEIDDIDIMDVNAGRHGRFFATNFDPETNLREIREEVIYWEDGWRRCPPHSKSAVFDFPEVGQQRLFCMGHEELHSLPSFVSARRIEFWMGFSERYLRVFTTLNNLGLLSPTPVEVDGATVAPLKLLKALLPEPQTLAKNYTGGVCIGCLVRGKKNGAARTIFIYSSLQHQAAYGDIGAQAISYTTAIPMLTAALLIVRGDWRVGRLVNAEELPAEPFLQLMPALGIPWAMREENPDTRLSPVFHDINNPPVII